MRAFRKPAVLRSIRSFAAFWGLVSLAFCAFFDPSILNPTNIGWISDGDLRQHYLGWVAFRQAETLGAPWGSSPLLAYPFGAPIAATDSNPLVSFMLWPIEDFLPEDFQFIGLWYLLCIAISLFVATALMRNAGFGQTSSLMLGAVLAFQPVLFWRYGHDTLMAQWLILASIYVVFGVSGFIRAMSCHAVLLALAISIHPYLFVLLNFVVGFDLLFRVFANRGLRFGLIEQTALAFAFVQIAALYFGGKLGVFALETEFANKTGVHTTDLLSAINPFDASRVMPQLPAAEGQYEGFAYLGLGLILFAIVLSVLAVRGQLKIRHSHKMVPLYFGALAAFLFALGPTITALGDPLLSFNLGDESIIGRIFEKLRSSGRFVWLTVYVAVFALLLTLPTNRPVLVNTIALSILLVQFWDLAPLRERSRMDTAWREVPSHELTSAEWRMRIDRAEYIFLSRKLGLDFSLHAGAAAFPRNTALSWFYTAQGLGLPKQHAAGEQLRIRVLNGRHDANALYLLDPVADLPLAHRNADDILVTQSHDEFHAIETEAYLASVPIRYADHGLTELLQLCEESCTWVITAKGAAFSNLSAQAKAYLGVRGSRIAERQDGDAYVAVARNGQLLKEEFGRGEDAALNATLAGRVISALSSVQEGSRPASISVDGADYSRNGTGLNVVMIADSGRMFTAHFDTSRYSDSLYPDDLFEDDLLQVSYSQPDLRHAVVAGIVEPRSGDQPFIGMDRYLSEESSLLDVISRCRQDCTMAISVKDEGAASLPRRVRESAAQIGLTMADLDYRDGYSAIIEDGIVLVQGRSSDEVVDVAEVVSGRRLRVQSAGFAAGSVSSITVDGVEESMSRRGFNIVVLIDGERTISYHFDTHGGV